MSGERKTPETAGDSEEVGPEEVGPEEVAPEEVAPEEVVEAEVVAEAEPSPQDPIETARAEAASHLDDLRRLKAEFENYRKRVLKEQTHLAQHASQQMVERLLPILDNFELALLASDQTKDFGKLVRGVEMVFGELLDLLHREGLAKIEAHGKPFDPELHEAVLDAEGDGEPVVVEVLRPGYTLKGRVVRPAMVRVGRQPPPGRDGEG
ncbi:MAG: nucleotide exchange factor GrpE [Acidobacteria bacterium]|nr:nucleotide exchange factor GrpE [Acidobacteriota bacterium]